MVKRPLLGVVLVAVLAVVTGLVITAGASTAAAASTVTVVNRSGETLWIGSQVNADGSQALVGLPTLAPGASAVINIPDQGGASHWRGTIFARQVCTGQGGSFHCVVGDCGAAADRCVTGQQPVSLAEFNFDRADAGAPWYDVSYVDALSVPITISPAGTDPALAAGACARGCTGGEMLAACPAEDAEVDSTGRRVVCVNPNRDAQTAYTERLGAFAPRAYLWSTHDRTGDPVVFSCGGCTDFVITFYGGGSGAPPPTGPAASPTGRTTATPRPTATPGATTSGATTPRATPSRGATTPRPTSTTRTATPPPSSATSGTTASAPAGGGSGAGPTYSWRGPGGFCVDVPDGRSVEDAPLQLWDCNGTAAQAFTRGAAGQEMILGKCLDIVGAAKGHGQNDGASVRLASCNGGLAQLWVREGSSLRNPYANRCLDVPSSNAVRGVRLQVWDCNGTGAQQWAAIA